MRKHGPIASRNIRRHNPHPPIGSAKPTCQTVLRNCPILPSPDPRLVTAVGIFGNFHNP